MKITLYRVGLREVYITEDYIEVPIYNEKDLVKGLFERGLYYGGLYLFFMSIVSISQFYLLWNHLGDYNFTETNKNYLQKKDVQRSTIIGFDKTCKTLHPT